MASHSRFRRPMGALVALVFISLAAVSHAGPAPRTVQVRHDVVVNASRFEFVPARIDATVGDIIKITLVAEDIPHTFTIDRYRISKRAAPGKPVTFEFHVSHAGTFDFYCDLAIDAGCRKMKGALVVTEPPR